LIFYIQILFPPSLLPRQKMNAKTSTQTINDIRIRVFDLKNRADNLEKKTNKSCVHGLVVKLTDVMNIVIHQMTHEYPCGIPTEESNLDDVNDTLEQIESEMTVVEKRFP
jgi:hypothetical protein